MITKMPLSQIKYFIYFNGFLKDSLGNKKSEGIKGTKVSFRLPKQLGIGLPPISRESNSTNTRNCIPKFMWTPLLF